MKLFINKPKAEPAVPVATFDFLKCEAAFLAAGYRIQRAPFLVRQGGKWRPLADGELERFLRQHLEKIGRTDLWSDELTADVQSFLKAGAL